MGKVMEYKYSHKVHLALMDRQETTIFLILFG